MKCNTDSSSSIILLCHYSILSHSLSLSLSSCLHYLHASLVNFFFGAHNTYLILCLSGVTSESSWTDDPQWRTTNNASCSSAECTNHTSCNTKWSSSPTNSGCSCLKFAGQWTPIFLCSKINVSYFVHCSASFRLTVTVIT